MKAKEKKISAKKMWKRGGMKAMAKA